LLFEAFIIDVLGRGVESVRERLEVDGGSGDFLLCRLDEVIALLIWTQGGVDRAYVEAVSKVASVGEAQTHNTVIGLNQGSICSEAEGIWKR
jgi:hypothetical protein